VDRNVDALIAICLKLTVYLSFFAFCFFFPRGLWGCGGVANMRFSAASRRSIVSRSLYCSLSRLGIAMPESSSHDVYAHTLTEIGRITTTWAKFEHWIEQAIWILADVDARKGACMTTQIGSIHGKFRALIALMVEAGRPKEALKAADKLSDEAGRVVKVRTRFAHGPLDMGVNFDTRDFEVYLRRVAVSGKDLDFRTSPITEEELDKALKDVSQLYMSLLNQWPLIIGKAAPDALAPPHE
jgi:hypothetical protein